MTTPLPPKAAKALLKFEYPSEPRFIYARLRALRQLGKLDISYERIVKALVRARDSDPDERIRKLASDVLLAPMHQEVLNQLPPNWQEKAEEALKTERDSGTRTDNYSRQITTATALAIGLIGVIPGAVVWFFLVCLLAALLRNPPENHLLLLDYIFVPIVGSLVGDCLGSLLSKRTVKFSILGAIIGGVAIGGILGYGALERPDLFEDSKRYLLVLEITVIGGANRNLHDADLRGADLSRVDLSGAYLYRADLRGADLSGADLREAYLNHADLRGADLSGADLSGAYLLYGVDLSGADLHEADLYGANLSGAYLREVNLTGASVTYEQLAQAKSLKGAILPDGTKHD